MRLAFCRSRHLRLALAATSALVVGTAHAQDLASARNFVAAIYAHYPAAEKRPEFDPLAGGADRTLFDAQLVGLIREDRRLSGHEVGALDGDPLCDCQDDGGTRFQVGEARAAGPGTATVTVVRRGPDREKPEPIILRLVHTSAGWRIHDIQTPYTPSLRDLLIKSNLDRK